MADSTSDKQSDNTSRTVLTSSAGSIEFNGDAGGSTLSITHPNGSNTVYGEVATSHFNSNNEQTMTLNDSFHTVYGDASSYTRGTMEHRVEGDYVQFIGPRSVFENDVAGRWFKAYGNGLGALKSQFDDNRGELTANDYPTNTVYETPAAAGSITVCPELKDGTAKDNQNDSSRAEFEKSMMDTNTIKGSQASQSAQTNLNKTYGNINSNMSSLKKSLGS
jgi:hypothetical protein